MHTYIHTYIHKNNHQPLFFSRKVPPVAGKSTRVSYAIANLDLSGFRLRKEDVEVQVVDLSSGSTGDGMERAAEKTDDRGGRTNYDRASVDSRGVVGVSVEGVDAFGDDREMAAVPWATVTKEAVQPGGVAYASPASRSELPAAGSMIAGSESRKPPSGETSTEGTLAYPYYDGAVEGGPFSGRGLPVEIRDNLGPRQPVGPPEMPREELKPAEVLKVVARGVGAEFKTLQWACRQVGQAPVQLLYPPCTKTNDLVCFVDQPHAYSLQANDYDHDDHGDYDFTLPFHVLNVFGLVDVALVRSKEDDALSGIASEKHTRPVSFRSFPYGFRTIGHIEVSIPFHLPGCFVVASSRRRSRTRDSRAPPTRRWSTATSRLGFLLKEASSIRKRDSRALYW